MTMVQKLFIFTLSRLIAVIRNVQCQQVAPVVLFWFVVVKNVHYSVEWFVIVLFWWLRLFIIEFPILSCFLPFKWYSLSQTLSKWLARVIHQRRAEMLGRAFPINSGLMRFCFSLLFVVLQTRRLRSDSLGTSKCQLFLHRRVHRSKNSFPDFRPIENCTFLQSQSEQPSPRWRLWASWCWAGKDRAGEMAMLMMAAHDSATRCTKNQSYADSCHQKRIWLKHTLSEGIVLGNAGRMCL